MTTSTLIPDRAVFRRLVAEMADKAKAKLPACNGRVESAVKLVLAGDVEGQEPDGTWRVGSCTDPLTTHRVSGTSCSCDDSQYGRAPQGYCKHVLAVMIHLRVQALLPPPVAWPEDEELAPESTPAVHPVSTSALAVAPLPEAPASVNVRLTIAGREVQWTLRDTDEGRLAVRLEELLQRYPAPQAASQPRQAASPEPAPLTPQQHNALAQHQAVTGWCKVHNVEMKLNQGKDGRTWYSHFDEAAGRWCKGK